MSKDSEKDAAGIGYLFNKKFLPKQKRKASQWDRIEYFAKQHGLYSPLELIQLIKEHSPVNKKIGITNLQILRVIEDGIRQNPKASTYSVIKDNLKRIFVLRGEDPRLIHWGKAWEDAELAAKRNPKKATKNYGRQIENFRKKRTDLLNKHKKLFKNWYEQNKDDNYIDFIDWVIKELEDPKLKGKGYYHGPKGKIKY